MNISYFVFALFCVQSATSWKYVEHFDFYFPEDKKVNVSVRLHDENGVELFVKIRESEIVNEEEPSKVENTQHAKPSVKNDPDITIEEIKTDAQLLQKVDAKYFNAEKKSETEKSSSAKTVKKEGGYYEEDLTRAQLYSFEFCCFVMMAIMLGISEYYHWKNLNKLHSWMNVLLTLCVVESYLLWDVYWRDMYSEKVIPKTNHFIGMVSLTKRTVLRIFVQMVAIGSGYTDFRPKSESPYALIGLMNSCYFTIGFFKIYITGEVTSETIYFIDSCILSLEANIWALAMLYVIAVTKQISKLEKSYMYYCLYLVACLSIPMLGWTFMTMTQVYYGSSNENFVLDWLALWNTSKVCETVFPLILMTYIKIYNWWRSVNETKVNRLDGIAA